MIYRNTIEEVQKYYEEPSINQSALKEILNNGMQSFLDKSDEIKREKKHLIIGSAVDTKITMGEEVYNQTFYTGILDKKPGDAAMAVIKEVFSVVSGRMRTDDIDLLRSYPEEIYNACNNNEYYMNRKKANYEDDNRIAEILKNNAEGYWFELCEAATKQILSADESMKADNVVNSILTHPHTAHLFKDSDDIDIIYQFAIYFVINGIPCKCLLDMIIVNHTIKRIIPIDIKTMGDYVLNFPTSVRAWRYDIQAAWYTTGLVAGAGKLAILIGKDLDDYTISNFAFIAESTKSTGTPFIFPLSDSILECGRKGDGRYLMGYEQALNMYKSWADSAFDINTVFRKTKGILFIEEGFECSTILTI